MISHRQLVHALTLFKHGNFTRAAAQSNISQSAFSRSIQNLETDLGVCLFDRDKSTVRPTRYGEVLLRRAEAIIVNAEELEREMGLMRGLEVGDFTVALGIYPAEISGNQALGNMLKDYPKLRYRAHLGNWEMVSQLVLSRGADLGFAALESAESDKRLTVSHVNPHEMVLYCRKNHPLAQNGKPSREDLDQFPLVSIRVPGGIASAVPGKAEIDPDSGYLVPSVEIDDFKTARTILSHSDGIGVAIPLQIESELESGEFVVLNFNRPFLKPALGFILLKNRAVSPAAEVFMENVLALEAEADTRNKALLEKYLR